jgi:hypothetical protein
MGNKFKNLRRVLRQWNGQISSMARIIENNKLMISFLDALEEFRGLALEEWNFMKLVRHHFRNLLEQQREYWRQRCRIKWATLGDENTKKFMQLQPSDILRIQ